MRVEFAAAVVAWRDVDHGEVPNAENLNVVGSLNEVRAADRPIRNEARTVASLGAPRNFDSLSVSDC